MLINKKAVVVILVMFQTILSFGQVQRNLLSSKYSETEVKACLRDPQKWYSEGIYPSKDYSLKYTAQQKEDIIRNAEKYLNYKWPAVLASSYIAFDAIGSRDSMERIYFARNKGLDALVEGELVEAKGRFLYDIINGVWSVCEESFWGISAHVDRQKRPGALPDVNEPIIDLFAAEKAQKLSRIHYLFRAKFDAINPLISDRIRIEVKKRVLVPYYTRNDFSWFGFDDKFVNNWNPWINSNMLSTVLLMEENPDLRAKAAYKAMRSMDKYINFVKADGWCDEGPSYWGVAGAKLFSALDLLYQSSNGKINIFQNEIIHNLGKYIYNAYIGNDYYVNFADAACKNTFDPELIFKWGEVSSDSKMMGFASFLAHKSGRVANIKINEYPAWEPLQSSFWFPDNQIAGGHDNDKSSQGFYMVAKGGHNAESHNHNDVGTCIVHYNNQPILIDAGKLFYTKFSFGPKRYTYWPTRSNFHNVPTINGVEQHDGREYAAQNVKFSSNNKQLQFSLDISKAYPKEANVEYWNRTYTLKRNKAFIIDDQYKLSKVVGENYLNFLTCCKASIIKPGIVCLKSDSTTIHILFDPQSLSAVIDEFDTNDKTVEVSWGKRLTHLRFKVLSQNPQNQTSLTFKSVD